MNIAKAEEKCNKWVEELAKVMPIKPKTVAALKTHNSKWPGCYGVVKTHKEVADVMDTPQRPVIPACDAPTSKLQTILLYAVGDIRGEFKEQVDSTGELLHHVSKLDGLDENTILFSWDVKSAFPNIEMDLALDAFIELVSRWENGIAKNRYSGGNAGTNGRSQQSHEDKVRGESVYS